MQILAIILLPYTLPRANEIPIKRPTINEIKVRIIVIFNPSRRFGKESNKKLKNSDVIFPPYSFPYSVAILPRNSLVLAFVGLRNI
jgi:hypothetical protein